MWNRSVHNLWISQELRAYSGKFVDPALDLVARDGLCTLQRSRAAKARQLVHILSTGFSQEIIWCARLAMLREISKRFPPRAASYYQMRPALELPPERPTMCIGGAK